jgi:hypothetical protein
MLRLQSQLGHISFQMVGEVPVHGRKPPISRARMVSMSQIVGNYEDYPMGT